MYFTLLPGVKRRSDVTGRFPAEWVMVGDDGLEPPTLSV